MKESYNYEELKDQISVIKTPEEFNEKEVDLKYKIYSTYYNHSINRYERDLLLDWLSVKLYEVFGLIE